MCSDILKTSQERHETCEQQIPGMYPRAEWHNVKAFHALGCCSSTETQTVNILCAVDRDDDAASLYRNTHRHVLQQQQQQQQQGCAVFTRCKDSTVIGWKNWVLSTPRHGIFQLCTDPLIPLPSRHPWLRHQRTNQLSGKPEPWLRWVVCLLSMGLWSGHLIGSKCGAP